MYRFRYVAFFIGIKESVICMMQIAADIYKKVVAYKILLLYNQYTPMGDIDYR